MRAGELRARVIHQRLTVTLDAMGDQVREYVNLATVRAKVQAMRGNESYQSGQNQIVATSDHRVIMRYRDVRPTDRLIYGDRILDVVHAGDMYGNCRWLLIRAVERVGEYYVPPIAPGDPGFDFTKAANSQYLPLLEEMYL